MNRSDAARYALAAIRIFNGGTALLAPERLDARLGLDRSADYPWRMFGIRTVLMGVDLLSSDPRGEASRPAGLGARARLGHDLGRAGRLHEGARPAGGYDRDRHLGGQRGAGADCEP